MIRGVRDVRSCAVSVRRRVVPATASLDLSVVHRELLSHRLWRSHGSVRRSRRRLLIGGLDEMMIGRLSKNEERGRRESSGAPDPRR